VKKRFKIIRPPNCRILKLAHIEPIRFSKPKEDITKIVFIFVFKDICA
jgi:hypothetical protein